MDESCIVKLFLFCSGVMRWHMTALWAADCDALSLHPGDRLPCKVASLCMSASDGEMTETKCYLSANCVCVCVCVCRGEGRGSLLPQSCGYKSNYSCK